MDVYSKEPFMGNQPSAPSAPGTTSDAADPSARSESDSIVALPPIISSPLGSAKDNDGERLAAAVVSGPTTVTVPAIAPAPTESGLPDQPTLFLGISSDIPVNHGSSIAANSVSSSSNVKPSVLVRLNLSHVTAAAPGMDAGLTTRREYNETELGDMEQFRHESMLLRCAQECSEVGPSLFVSSHEMATRIDVLRACRVTCVINLAAELFDCPLEADGIMYYAVSLSDTPNEDITCFFYSVIEIIERVRAAGGCTLLHCQLGVSRSGALAIAYIMWLHNCSFADALLRVQAGRGCVNPNPGFVAQLLEWEADLLHIRDAGSPCFTSSADSAGLNVAARLYAVRRAPSVLWMSARLRELLGKADTVSSSHYTIPFVLQLVRSPVDNRPVAPASLPLLSCAHSDVYVVRGPATAACMHTSPNACPAWMHSSAARERVTVFAASDVSLTSPSAQVVMDEITRWATLPTSMALPNQTSSGENVYAPCTTSVDMTLAMLQCAGGGLPNATDASTATLYVSPWLIGGPQSRIVSAWAAVADEAAGSSSLSTITEAALAVENSASRPQSGSTAGSRLSLSSLPTADEHEVPLMAPRRADDSKLHMRTHSASSSSDTLSAKPTLFKWVHVDAGMPWEDMGVFEADDLEDDGLFALVRKCDSGSLSVFGWIGHAFEAPDGESDVRAFATRVIQQLAPVVLDSDATIVPQLETQDDESDEFWDAFDF